MRRLLVAVLVVPVIAGCIAGTAPETDGGPTDGEAGSLDDLSFDAPVDLVCDGFERPPESCGEFGEPIVEVAGDGTIWASATCCIGETPPIWISEDGGESFSMLGPDRAGPTEMARQSYGIEGSFAIDDAGNVYFFDIALATTWFTSYTADAEHRHTVAHPMPPLVDRPWIRAGAEDEVYLFYNTGGSTVFVPSDDGGLTFDYTATEEFPCPLMNIGQGPTRDRMFVSGCPDDPRLWLTTDAGATWSSAEAVPLPDEDVDDREMQFKMPASSDDDGWIYVPYTHNVTDEGRAVFVARRAPDGTWLGPDRVSPTGDTSLPWSASGRSGTAAVAYYHAPQADARDNGSAEWQVRVSSTVDGHAAVPDWRTVTADEEVLTDGQPYRDLGDFLQLDVTPDGRLALVYGSETGGVVQNRFAMSSGNVDLAPGTFLNGP